MRCATQLKTLHLESRITAAAQYPRSPAIKICVTDTMDMWLVNDTDTMAELKAGELVGFNVGSFKEIALGTVAGKTLMTLMCHLNVCGEQACKYDSPKSMSIKHASQVHTSRSVNTTVNQSVKSDKVKPPSVRSSQSRSDKTVPCRHGMLQR